MKKIYCLLLVLVAALAGCVQPPQQTKSALELQAIQAKEFETTKKIAFAATLSVFQDLGYTISSASLDTGLINANSPTQAGFILFVGRSMTHVNATAFIEEIIAGRTKIRVNFVKKQETSSGYGQRGGQDVPIEDPNMYQDVFTKIQQGIFIRKNVN